MNLWISPQSTEAFISIQCWYVKGTDELPDRNNIVCVISSWFYFRTIQGLRDDFIDYYRAQRRKQARLVLEANTTTTTVSAFGELFIRNVRLFWSFFPPFNCPAKVWQQHSWLSNVAGWPFSLVFREDLLNPIDCTFMKLLGQCRLLYCDNFCSFCFSSACRYCNE